MSNSATTAAKRRRTGVMTPMMQNTAPTVQYSAAPMTQNTAGPIARPRNAPALQKDIAINNSNANKQSQPANMQSQAPVQSSTQAKPLTLTQVIGHIDTRLLSLEHKVTTVTETIAKYPDPDLIMETNDDEPLVSGVSEEVLTNFIKVDEVDAIVQENINPHVQEFDHRYQVLAGEIAELKQALMKLQTYTLEINKTLFEERIQILSEMTPNMGPNVNKTVDEDTNLLDKQSTNTEITAEEVTSEEIIENVEDVLEPEPEPEPEPEFDINQLIAQSM